MELKEFKDIVPTMSAFSSLQAEIPLETDILLSDYQSKVFKVVKCLAEPVILQKTMEGNQLLLSGYLRCFVYYQAEDSKGLSAAEQKVSFEKRFELPEHQATGWLITVGGELEYLNYRAVNERHIELRGAYAFWLRFNLMQSQEVLTALSDGGVEQKFALLEGNQMIANLEKQFLAENELQFEVEPAEILDITGTSEIRELKILSGKAVAKGELTAQIAYRTADEKLIRNQSAKIPFSQIVDAPGLEEDCKCLCIAQAVGYTLAELKGEQKSHRVSATTILHLRAFRPFSIQTVADAFSTQYESETNKGQAAYIHQCMPLDTEIATELSVNLPDENAVLLAVLAKPEIPQLGMERDAPYLQGKLRVNVIYLNVLGEIECLDQACDYGTALNLQEKSENMCVECWAHSDVSNALQRGAELKLELKTKLEGVLLVRRQTEILQKLTITEPLQQPENDIALRIYYAGAGESLFQIARRFHVSPTKLAKLNRQPEDQLEREMRLLIPGLS